MEDIAITATKKCQLCQGTGKVTNHKNKTSACSACGGTGRKTINLTIAELTERVRQTMQEKKA